MTANRQQLEALASSGEWFNNQRPTVVIASEAYTQQDGHRFYTVAWWGTDDKPLPAGFTRFDFQGVTTGGYAIIWRDEPRDREGQLPADELVLMFIE